MAAPGRLRRLRRAATVCAILVAAALQLRPFLDGWILTADDALFQYWGLTRPVREWISWSWEIAVWKGKLGEAFSMPVMIAGNVAIDQPGVRAANLAAFAASVGLFALWLGRQFGAAFGLAFGLVALALTPLRFFHMPPTSFPFFPTVQIGLLLICLMAIRTRGPGGAAAFLGLTLALVSAEYALVLGAALILFEAARDIRSPNALVSDGRLLALALALAVHAAFALAIAQGDYLDASLGGEVRRVAEVIAFHTANGTTLGPAGLPFAEAAVGAAERVRALAAGTATGLAVLLAAPWLRQGAAPSPWVALALALGLVLALTLPIALLEKYRAWCDPASACAYLDSRYAGWAAMVALALPLAWAARALPAWPTAVALGLLAAVTALHNGAVAAEMRAWRAPWRAAEAAHCAGASGWEAFLATEAAGRVPFHVVEGRDRSDYWHAWSAGVTCAERAR